MGAFTQKRAESMVLVMAELYKQSNETRTVKIQIEHVSADRMIQWMGINAAAGRTESEHGRFWIFDVFRDLDVNQVRMLADVWDRKIGKITLSWLESMAAVIVAKISVRIDIPLPIDSVTLKTGSQRLQQAKRQAGSAYYPDEKVQYSQAHYEQRQQMQANKKKEESTSWRHNLQLGDDAYQQALEMGFRAYALAGIRDRGTIIGQMWQGAIEQLEKFGLAHEIRNANAVALVEDTYELQLALPQHKAGATGSTPDPREVKRIHNQNMARVNAQKPKGHVDPRKVAGNTPFRKA